MKKVLLIAAVTMASASAFASVARVGALGAVNGGALPTTGGLTLTGVSNLGATTAADDIQDVFVNPGKMHSFGDAFTVEFMGGTSTQGGVFRGNGDSKMGVYFNKKSSLMPALQQGLNGLGGSTTALGEQNAFELFYGMKSGMKWGASLTYMDAKDQDAVGANGSKATAMGARFGAVTDMWEAYLGLGLSGKTELANGSSSTADMAIRAGGQYNMGNMNVHLDFQTGGGKTTVGTTDTKASSQLITLGTESKVKGEGSHFFYGVRYVSFNQKVGEGSATASKLPVYAGIEFDAASWLVLRASMSQSMLVNSTKITTNATPSVTTQDHSNLADTAAGFGLGMKWGKALFDGAITAVDGGSFGLDGARFIGTTSLTYNF